MISHSQSHRWRPMRIAMYPLPRRQAQAAMSPLKIVIEELQAHECIEGSRPVWQTQGSCE